MKLTIPTDRATGPMPKFWRSTGFTPASLLLDEPMQQLLAYLGSIPHRGVEFCRIHFLLELVRGANLLSDKPDYDWSLLDRGLDAMIQNRIRPFFELMGNPGGYFTNFEDPAQVHAWCRLVADLARHCIDRYGAQEVRGWYFETWNEPDVDWWKQPDQAFHNYYDACSAGLADVDPQLRMGGPGTCRHLSDRLKSFLAHCDTGKNFFTGQPGTRLDFISIHEKGATWSAEDLTPDMTSVTEREAATCAYIREHHPRFASLPFMNNECDPQIGWGTIHTWHAHHFYAGLIVRTINDHLRKLVDDMKVRYELLSNDNGFLGTWGMRTHLTLFGSKDQLAHGRFEQIKKPGHTVMTMLALLGDQRLAIEGHPDTYASLGAIATRTPEGQIAILLYHSTDEIHAGGSGEPIDLHLTGLPAGELTLAHYRLDKEHGNPYGVWHGKTLAHGHMPGPDKITHQHAELFARMRQAQELPLLAEPEAVRPEAGALTLRLSLPLPGVSLLLLTLRSTQAPGRVAGLRARRYHGLTGQAQVLLTWDPLASRTLRTYEVFYAPTAAGPFTRLNTPELLCSAYLQVAADVRGAYQVRAVDYWGRAGGPSEAVVV